MTRDLSRQQLEDALKKYGITMKWYQTPAEWKSREAAHLLLDGERFGTSYLRTVRTRKYHLAVLIEHAEKQREIRERRQRKLHSAELFDALKYLMENPNSLTAKVRAEHTLEIATYRSERNVAEQSELRTKHEAEAKNAKL